MSNKSLIYLAVPYSHPDIKIREHRFKQVNKVAAKLMADGHHIYSPISHTHPIALAGKLPTTWEYWKEYDYAFLKHSKKLLVLKLDGWETSAGVKGEIEIANELNIPVEYLDMCVNK